MKYIEATIHTERNNIDPLTCILMDMGVAGFVVSDPEDVDDFLNKKNTYDWDYVAEEVLRQKEEQPGVTFYLEDDDPGRALLAQISKMLEGVSAGLGIGQANPGAGQPGRGAAPMDLGMEQPGREAAPMDLPPGDYRLLFRGADDSEWKDNWKEYFKPAKITDRIVVKPTWETYEKKQGELVIEIDPGMAFGTGTHPTTSLCVRLLEKYIQGPEDVVLDVGCGSGILSIASALLGAKQTIGVEIDPVAVTVASENTALNGLTDRIEIRQGDLTKGLNVKADIVVANLMADLVMMLSADVAKHLRGRSIYISSGILLEKQAQVARSIEDCGFHIREILEEGEWCAICAALAPDL